MGRVQINWIDKQLTKCPFCHKSTPLWEMAMENRKDLKRYHFQCSGCGGTVSVSTAKVTGPGLTPLTTATHFAPKDAFRIECVGGSGSKIEVGHYFRPEDLRKLAEV